MHTLTMLTLGLGVAANVLPAVELGRRAAYAGGGWGLTTTASDQSGCPSGTTWYDAYGWHNINVCCPNGFKQQDNGDSNAQLSCCPQGSACLDAIETAPFCADSTWVLWNATTQTDNDVGYFCCLPGQIGTQNYECDSGSTNVPATLSAANLGQPVPTGAAGVTISVSAGTSSGITSAPSGQATGVTTTTKGGIGGVVSSVLAGVTGKSDASNIRPPSNPVDFVISGKSLFAVMLGFLAL